MLSNNVREESNSAMNFLRIIDCHVVDDVGSCFKSQLTDSKQKRVRHIVTSSSVRAIKVTAQNKKNNLSTHFAFVFTILEYFF